MNPGYGRGGAMLLAVLGTYAVWMTGCSSYSTLGRARLPKAGQARVGGGLGVIGATSEDSITVLPRLELVGAYSPIDHLSLDAKIWFGGARLGARWQMVDGFEDLLDATVGLGVSAFASDKIGFDVPVSLGFRLPEGHEIIVTGRLSYHLWFGVGDTDTPVPFLFGGAGLGWFWPLSDTWGVLPEVSSQWVGYRPDGFGTPEGEGLGLQFSLGVIHDF